MSARKKWTRRIGYGLLVIFIGMNAMAAIHGYKFTHFAAPGTARTKDDRKMSAGEKLETVLLGISMPKPVNDKTPVAPFSTVRLNDGKKLEAWYLPADKPVGSIIVFHGYNGCRSGMLEKAEGLRKLGYNCLLPDFSGAGGSDGRSCTIGYREAEEVRLWYKYLRSREDGPLVLMGQSMGAAAIMKAVRDTPMQVAALILECPYGSMQQTVENRFRSMGLPSFPMSQLLVFWGGALQGFNAFSLNPERYARSITIPTLLVRGTADPRVTKEETGAIFNNLRGPKHRLELAGAEHNDYLEKGGAEWSAAMSSFLEKYTPAQ